MKKTNLVLMMFTLSSSAFAISDNAAREIWNQLDSARRQVISMSANDIVDYTQRNGGAGGLKLRAEALNNVRSLLTELSPVESKIVAVSYGDEHAEAIAMVNSMIALHNRAAQGDKKAHADLLVEAQTFARLVQEAQK